VKKKKHRDAGWHYQRLEKTSKPHARRKLGTRFMKRTIYADRPEVIIGLARGRSKLVPKGSQKTPRGGKNLSLRGTSSVGCEHRIVAPNAGKGRGLGLKFPTQGRRKAWHRISKKGER